MGTQESLSAAEQSQLVMQDEVPASLTLAGIADAGGFVDTAPVAKRIEWRLGGKLHKGRVFVVRQPFGAVESVLQGDFDRSRAAQLISMSIRLGDDAREQLSYDQAYGLHPALAWALTAAINEVNAGKN